MPKYTQDEWDYSHKSRLHACAVQKYIASQTIAKSEKVCRLSSDKVKSNREETDHHLGEAITQVEYFKDELVFNRKDISNEIDALTIYRDRIRKSLDSLKEKALNICEQCLAIRKKRIGIDLVLDDVEKELRKECHLIKCSQSAMEQILKQSIEQIRCLKSSQYYIDRDLEDKENHLRIDRYNQTLQETNLNLSVNIEDFPFPPSSISTEDWEMHSMKLISLSTKEIRTARQVRVKVDTSLRQILHDLKAQKQATDEAFEKRIEDTKRVKGQLEEHHAEIVQQVSEMTRNITKLQTLIAEKEGFVGLAHTRLGHRTQRPNLELICDSVEHSLENELVELKKMVASLQQSLRNAQASLRHLLKIQVELEEDINVKINSLKLDEVDCMTLRQSIDYRMF